MNTLATYTSIARERGVTTIPAELREKAAIRPDVALTWVEIEPQLWLVGPETRHPERVASAVAEALAVPSPFPKLMRRLATGDIGSRNATAIHREFAPIAPPELTEAQMIALGTTTEPTPRYRRGRH